MSSVEIHLSLLDHSPTRISVHRQCHEKSNISPIVLCAERVGFTNAREPLFFTKFVFNLGIKNNTRTDFLRIRCSYFISTLMVFHRSFSTSYDSQLINFTFIYLFSFHVFILNYFLILRFWKNVDNEVNFAILKINAHKSIVLRVECDFNENLSAFFKL